ncbi:Ltp family lipoprotein, partial [Nocardioides sp.]|uniref:Ltp family lipoprotein n=1 Tax=Nocardioides sp. TaxID=35761 RepID=UPI0027361241
SAAEDYLDYSAFSRQGLIDQLSSEYGSGFRVEDAAWAVGQLKVDWREQAVRAAKEYLDYSPFSRQGLIEQLSSPYGSQFTVAEATYAVNKIGL